MNVRTEKPSQKTDIYVCFLQVYLKYVSDFFDESERKSINSVLL
jgi:hypothetical protein